MKPRPLQPATGTTRGASAFAPRSPETARARQPRRTSDRPSADPRATLRGLKIAGGCRHGVRFFILPPPSARPSGSPPVRNPRRALSRPAHRVPVRRAARPPPACSTAGRPAGGRGVRRRFAAPARSTSSAVSSGACWPSRARPWVCACAPGRTPCPRRPSSRSTEGSFRTRGRIAFAKDRDVVAVEIDTSADASARELEKAGVDVQPCSDTLAIIQDKFAQKEHFQKAGVPLGPFQSVESEEQLARRGVRVPPDAQVAAHRRRQRDAVARTEADVKRRWRNSVGSRKACTARSGSRSSASSQ